MTREKSCKKWLNVQKAPKPIQRKFSKILVLFLLHPWLSAHQGMHLTCSKSHLCKIRLTKIVILLFLVELLFLAWRKMKGFSLTSIVLLLIFCMHKLYGYIYLFYLSYTSIQYTYFLSGGASHMFLHVYFIWDAYSLNSDHLIPDYWEIQMFVALYVK